MREETVTVQEHGQRHRETRLLDLESGDLLVTDCIQTQEFGDLTHSKLLPLMEKVSSHDDGTEHASRAASSFPRRAGIPDLEFCTSFADGEAAI